ncbi:hypothetical protein ACWGJ2_04330 [Streptomyces sp. NPDC054796]
MTTALDQAPAPVGRRAAVDLAAIREQWGDLLLAVEQPPAQEWPPREAKGFLNQLAPHDDQLDEVPATATIGRAPLVLREHPAPLNLDALDAALAVERELFELADTVAAAVQRPTRGQDDDDPARWRFPAPEAPSADPGSRAYGLHWAAVWLEGRALDEMSGDLFAPMPLRLLDEVAAAARRSRTCVEHALGRDERTTTLDRPCPWCGAELVGRTRAEAEPVVTCSTGEACGAPVPLDGRRRAWRGADLVSLYAALDQP